MSETTITILILVAVVAVFIWNRLPAAVVAVAAALALFLTGILNVREALGGFGDPVIVFVASLLAIGAGLEASGVGTWAGQILIRHAGASQSRLLLALMLLSALFSALIGMNGAVAAMIPVAVIIAVRTGIVPSQLMIPVAFAALAGSKVTLLGTPVNVIASAEAEMAGLGPIRFFEWAVVGIPLVAGTLGLILMFGRRLLPERRSRRFPPISARMPPHSSSNTGSTTDCIVCGCGPPRLMPGSRGLQLICRITPTSAWSRYWMEKAAAHCSGRRSPPTISSWCAATPERWAGWRPRCTSPFGRTTRPPA